MESYGKFLGEQTKPARFSSAFHGECWYTCPWCDKPFEFWATRYSGKFKKEADGVYRHNECGKLLTIN